MTKPLNVLILDDRPSDAELMIYELHRAGLNPTWQCVDTKARYLAGLDTGPDIILADYQQPTFDALRALKLLQERGLPIPFLIVSGVIGEDLAVEAMKLGATDYLMKDRLTRLGQAVIQALAQTRLREEKQQAEAALRAEHAEALRARDELRQVNEQLQQAFQKANGLAVVAERESRTKSVLLAAIHSILIGVDENDHIINWNMVAEQAFGIRAASALNKPFSECGIHWDWPHMQEQIEACRRTGKSIRLNDYHFTRPNDTEGILGITLTPIVLEEDKQPRFLLLGADITERKFLESQLAHAQKMESIGQLAAGIAHEINTPTQYVGDNTRFLQEAFEELRNLLATYEELIHADTSGIVAPELAAQFKAAARKADVDYLLAEIPKAVSQSLDGIARVAKIVQAMKEFSHPGVEEKTAIDINRAIESTITVARNEWKYVAEMVTDFDPALPAVPCLPGEINQVILNIIVNATHAITAVVGDGSERKGVITVSTRRQGDWAEIHLSDTGTGIPEAARAKVFDPFFTTKEVGKGTGQGLAIAHAVVVDKHGGTIRFETEMGRGTTFTIRLPLDAEQLQAAA